MDRALTQKEIDAWSERNKQGYETMKTVLGLMPIIGTPIAGLSAYDDLRKGDYVGAGLNAATGLLGAASTPAAVRAGAVNYSKATMPLRKVNVNIEATSPDILQRANESNLGLTLSDARFRQALEGARSKGMKMADAPYAKTQGAWVDPSSGASEFNRVYSQNVGRFGYSPIEQNKQLTDYALSMGGDLDQWGVGAARFSPLPANLAKDYATAVKYNKVSPSDVINTAKNLKGGVVFSTPDGGMLVFDPDKILKPTEIAKQIKNISSKPKFGLLDNAYIPTRETPESIKQGAYMKDIDKLIMDLGY